MFDNVVLNNKDVLIVDYKVGNSKSITNALDFLGYRYSVSDSPIEIENAQAYILPGVGAFGEAVKNLKSLKIFDILNEQILVHKKPILGICLGMQLMANFSEEKGNYNGFGWIEGTVKKIKKKKNLSIPHVGWNEVSILNKNSLLWNLKNNPHFYFDHSYCYQCEDTFITSKCQYGGSITASIQYENIFGVQFHPEKSQQNGLRLLRSFFDYTKSKKLIESC